MSLLDLVRIATPCSEAWDAMTGDRKTRHCGRCDKQVFDLSQRTRAEVEALLAEKGTAMCARIFERTDGSIVLADCIVRRRRRVAVAAGVAAVLAGGVVAHETPQPVVAEPAPVVELGEAVDVHVDVVEVQADVRDKAEIARDALDELAKRDPNWRFTQIEGSFTGGVLASDELGKALSTGFEELILEKSPRGRARSEQR